VQGQRHVLDVVKVVFQLGDGVLQGVAVLVVDLRPAGDAGPHAVALPVVGNLLVEGFDELGALRAGAHDGHLALQDVEELRQLVEADGADDAADGGDARIVLLGPYRAGADLGIDTHGTKLIHGEQRVVEANASLAVEHRSGGRAEERGGAEQDGTRGRKRSENRGTTPPPPPKYNINVFFFFFFFIAGSQ